MDSTAKGPEPGGATLSMGSAASPPPTGGAELLGRTLGGCRIEEKLGQGGMGLVFKATHLALERIVALKVLSPGQFHDPKKVEQFFLEARSAAALEHENIVAVHDVGQEQGLYYIVMQYVEGESLAARIDREGKLPPPEAARIALETARGLATAHGNGIIHRDIKPGNVMLSKDGRVRIADFGLAHRMSGEGDLTTGLGMAGTPGYMSPEQVDGGAVDHRSDLYAVGVMLYLMTTGRKPFTGANPMEVLVKHVREKPVPPREVNRDLPKEMGLLIERLLAKNPDNRYADADTLAEDLEEILEGGKPKVVVAVEDALQRMEKLARQETGPVRERKPLVAAVASGIAAALCTVLLTVALPEVATPEKSAAAADSGSVAQSEAEQAYRALEEYVRENPGDLLTIRRTIEDFENEYPPPYPARAEALRREAERRYANQSRFEVKDFLSRSVRRRAAGDVPGALVALYEIPERWLLEETGQEVLGRRVRLHDELVADTGLVLVPPGPFLSGPEKTEASLPAFLIESTEVSNADYAAFVDETGHASPSYWDGARCPKERLDDPVVGVSFADARAYASWKGRRLPTALEWEKAARGTDGREFPWGKKFEVKRSNCQSFHDGLAPVDKFPGGASPWGCLNLTGNAHEWTSTVAPGSANRWVCGGAHKSYYCNSRTFSKIEIDEDENDPSLAIGFRCAMDLEE